MFIVIVAMLLVTVVTLSLVMVALVRSERQQALENELRLQARDVADMMQQSDSLIIWQDSPLVSDNIKFRIAQIREIYHADVWLLRQNGMLMSFGEDTASVSTLDDSRAIEQLRLVLDGNEISVQGMFSELGDYVVTIGVPWGAPNKRVQGAVLLHVPITHLDADYSDIIRYSVIAGVVAMIVGVGLTVLIARRQSRPIKEIQQVAVAFSQGDLTRRAPVRGDDDMAQLAGSINRMADDLSKLEESRRSFVANVSHELRSPLTCIQGYCQGMLDGTILEEERNDYLQVVLSESQRLTTLVNTLLDLSKYESGKLPLKESVFDLNNLILTVLFKFEQKIEKKGIDVDISFQEEPCPVKADADRITQVVTNLVDNAVKFTPEGGQLTVQTYCVDNLAYVSIKDTGIGISQDDLPFIFERFYKADKAHTSGMGTGLGLSIVKKILEQHGQNITCTSGSTGTNFVFTLARSRADGEAENRTL